MVIWRFPDGCFKDVFREFLQNCTLTLFKRIQPNVRPSSETNSNRLGVVANRDVIVVRTTCSLWSLFLLLTRVPRVCTLHTHLHPRASDRAREGGNTQCTNYSGATNAAGLRCTDARCIAFFPHTVVEMWEQEGKLGR